MIGLGTTRKTPALLRRVREDSATRLRLKYDPYFRSFERQRGAAVWHQGREMLMLSSNDYLGLGDHPKVVEAGRKALAEWGSGTTGSRMANGSRRYHRELEEALAGFLGTEDCFVTAAGYLACMSGVSTFVGRGDCVAVDRNVHSSIWSGIGLSGARAERFGHNDPESLRELLEGEREGVGGLMVATEGVFSMEGHRAPLQAITTIAREAGAFTVVDDAHGIGVLGDSGRGSLEAEGLPPQAVDLITGSLSKAFSSIGGFVAGSREVLDYYRTHAKPMIFSAAASPADAACAHAALEVMRDEPEHRERLWANTRFYREMVQALGLDTWGSETPAIPLVLGEKERAYRFWKKLIGEGIFTVMAIAPAVPPGRDLIRTAISARHEREQLERAGEVMERALKTL